VGQGTDARKDIAQQRALAEAVIAENQRESLPGIDGVADFVNGRFQRRRYI